MCVSKVRNTSCNVSSSSKGGAMTEDMKGVSEYITLIRPSFIDRTKYVDSVFRSGNRRT